MLDPGHYNGQNPYGGKWGKQGITEADLKLAIEDIIRLIII